jgi:D-arabinitol 2-dehydrogenase
MLNPQLFRQAARVAQLQAPRFSPRTTLAASSARHFSYTPCRFDKSSNDDHDAASTSGTPGESGGHEGQYARTDKSVRVEYPDEGVLPASQPVQGRGGSHFKRTLASFSLEGRVAVVTGGARGLGLVMAQALVASGADVALVDMNVEEARKSAQGLVDTYKSENPDAEK